MTSGDDADQDDEELPFEVENERLPAWSHAASALVIAVGIGVAAHLVPMVAFLPFLVASSLGRRFASTSMHAVIHDDGLTLGEREIRKDRIVDVWLDDGDPRVVVAIESKEKSAAPCDIEVLFFENQEQAKRFADELLARAPRTMIVAGHVPRPVDMLSPLRFVAIAAAFVATGSPVGAAALLFFAMGAYPVLSARQIVLSLSSRDQFEVRAAFGRPTTHPKASAQDLITGGSIRDVTLAKPPWVERSRARVIREIETAG